jgi:hypothetical protein
VEALVGMRESIAHDDRTRLPALQPVTIMSLFRLQYKLLAKLGDLRAGLTIHAESEEAARFSDKLASLALHKALKVLQTADVAVADGLQSKGKKRRLAWAPLGGSYRTELASLKVVTLIALRSLSSYWSI